MSKDESALWRHVMDEVEPLAEDNIAPEPESEPALRPPGAAAKKSEAPAQPRRPMPAPAPPAPSREPELRHGEAPGLEKRTKTRMRRGQMDIEATLDLHGMTQAEAHRALDDFLRRSQGAGKRTVRVITGKGGGKDLDSRRAGPGRGVLRDAVPRWLNEGPNRRMIKAFSHAAPKDGGEGALYVLLKRPK